jgi:glyoxylase-like metal-dependent hydrolase (beta-lactamase superfamily II)
MPMADHDAWTEPGCHEVAPGVHRIPCPLPGDGLRAVNVYAIEDGDGVALVDSGWRHPDCIAALKGGLAELGATLADVTQVICTHAHYDHYGLAPTIRDASGAPVLIGEVELGMLRVAVERGEYARWIDFRRRWLTSHGARAVLDEIERAGDTEDYEGVRGRGRWEPPDRVLADREQLQLRNRVLEARLTPGHTRGHLMFIDRRNGLLFAGDHVLPHITPSLGFEPFTDGRALEGFLQSLAATRELPVTKVLPGHGPVFEDLAGRVDELIAHHRVRLAACVEILAQLGPDSALEVARRLRWTRQERAFGDLDALNRMLAVTETVTHLELLAERGRLSRRAGETIRYAA